MVTSQSGQRGALGSGAAHFLVCPPAQNLGCALPGVSLVRGDGDVQVIRLLGAEGDPHALDNEASGPGSRRELYSFLIAAITNYPKLSGLK